MNNELNQIERSYYLTSECQTGDCLQWPAVDFNKKLFLTYDLSSDLGRVKFRIQIRRTH